MRIDLVSEHASPLSLLGGVDAGGQNVHVGELARALGRRGALVVVHTRRDDPTLPDVVPFADRVVVSHVAAGPAVPMLKDDLLPHMPEFSRRLRRAWSIDAPQAVHSHFWMSGLAALEAARPLGIPVLHTYHALGVVKRREQGVADTSPSERIEVEQLLAREMDRIIATTDDEARELVAMGGDPDRISVVPCGVDLGRFTPLGPCEPRATRMPRVLVVSRLVERKGIGDVIRAVAALSNVELVIAGGPPEAMLDSDDEARRYAELAVELGVDDRVDMRGAVGRDDIPALMRSADVVVCCPWYEPFGMVAVEAMACGVPVVASKVGGLAETVIHGSTGLHVPPRSPAALADAIARVLDDSALRIRLGKAAARRARRFGWDLVAEQTLAAIELARLPDVRSTRLA
jgi:D-inositol-3-phosphate glycosyltransferase